MLRLYDTMTKKVTPIQPLEPGLVKMYTCGPTVYRDAHIGNLRSYLMADWIRRVLEAEGISVTHVKNITDVGHMRQEVLEQGEDKVIAAALASGKTPQEIAQLYTDHFTSDERKLKITPAEHFPKATEHIEEMIAIVERLVMKGFAYEVQGNVYFQISRFSEYGKLSGNTQDDGLLEGVRVETDPLKRDPRDFTLWKQAEPGRELRWPSPWGEGFPGWHIECSAMSIKYLGERFDIHTGGVDNIFPHHDGEIAQSEGFTGRPVVDHWVHGQHLLADGVKMAKSTGNSFILSDLESRDIDPSAFRYLCLTVRFRTRLNFTFTALQASQTALLRLKNRVWEWETEYESSPPDGEAEEKWTQTFMERATDNLDMPGALALTWKMARSGLPSQVKVDLLRRFDKVLGLGLDDVSNAYTVPDEVLSELERRSTLRGQGKYDEADGIRTRLSEEGYVVEDTRNGPRVRPKSRWEARQERWPAISSSSEVESLTAADDEVDITIAVVASAHTGDVSRCIESAFRWVGDRSSEALVLDNGAGAATAEWLDSASADDSRIRVIHADHMLGDGAAKNVVLKQSRGRTIVMLDTSVEVTGDIYAPMLLALDDKTAGVTGPFGLRTDDMHHFHDGEGEAGDMDAMQAYCFAFRRSLLREVGMPRESFRFYRNLDLDYSFQFKDKGYRVVAIPDLPLVRHEHRAWAELGENERDELSRKNYRRFLDAWGDRTDLLVVNQQRD